MSVEKGKPQRQGEQFGVVQVDERIHEIVPVVLEGQDGDHRQDGHAQRHNDVADDLKCAGAVYARCLFQLSRDGHEKLAHQEDGVCFAKPVRYGER